MSEPIPHFDLYASLGVERDASDAAIRGAHRRRIRLAHPDRSPDPGADEESARLNIARDWLLDPARRARYDASINFLSPAPSRRRGVPRPVVADLDREPPRGDLELFVARCAHLTRREIHLLRTSRQMGAFGQAGEVVRHIVTETGRDERVEEAVAAALRVIPHLRGDRRLHEVLTWTALGLASLDLTPAEATVVLRPWQETLATPVSAPERIVFRAQTSLANAAPYAVTLVVLVIAWLVLVSLVVYGMQTR